MMTREEAIRELTDLKLACFDFFKADSEALEMAIEALKQPEIIRCKDCEFSEEVGPGLFVCNNEGLTVEGSYVDANWYCGNAKEKENWCSLCGKITNSKRCPNCGANLEVF